jgi:hypothetical protein
MLARRLWAYLYRKLTTVRRQRHGWAQVIEVQPHVTIPF